MSTKFSFNISFFVFTDIGMDLKATQEIPFLRQGELSTIGNYYSIILGASNETNGLLFGPLPVAYHHDYLVFIYGNHIRDPTLKDKRARENDFMTPCFVLLFFEVEWDRTVGRFRQTIKARMDQWFSQMKEVTDVTPGKLNDLDLIMMEEIGRELKKIEQTAILSPIRTALGKNIDFLDTIGHSLRRNIRIGFFGPRDLLFPLLRAAVFENFTGLEVMDTSKSDRWVVYGFENLCIEGVHLSSTDSLNLKTNVEPALKKCPKDFDGVLLAVVVPETPPNLVKKNIQTVLRGTPERCPLSLLVIYENGGNGDIAKTGVPEAISEAMDRTVSLIEDRDGRTDIQSVIINLVENIVPSLRSN